MKKKLIVLFISLFMITGLTTGCDLEEFDQSMKEAVKDGTTPKVSCTIEKQYSDEYGFSHYVEGFCKNDSSKDYNYLQVEFICYDKDGNNLGTAFDNTNNLLINQTWKFKAMALSNVKDIDHCEYHEVTGW